MIDAPGPWGTGPFVLTEGVSLIDSRSDRVVMEPNPTYWNPARRPSVRIVYDNVIGKAEGIKSVAAGDGRVDVVFDLTPDEANAFPASEHGRIQTKQAKTILTGVFNENRPDSPWRTSAPSVKKRRRIRPVTCGRTSELSNAAVRAASSTTSAASTGWSWTKPTVGVAPAPPLPLA